MVMPMLQWYSMRGFSRNTIKMRGLNQIAKMEPVKRAPPTTSSSRYENIPHGSPAISGTPGTSLDDNLQCLLRCGRIVRPPILGHHPQLEHMLPWRQRACWDL